MERILGFYPKGFSAERCLKMFKKLPVPKPYRRQTCFRTSGHRIGEILPNLNVVWTLFPGFWGQGVHFWGQKRKNMSLEKIAKKQWKGKKKRTYKKILNLKTLNAIANIFKKNFKHRKLGPIGGKTRLQSVLKGKLPTRSFFAF